MENSDYIGMTRTDSQPAQKKKRRWIYAKKPEGRLFRYRQGVGYALLALLATAPFIRINGEPMLMLNILERRFVLFGNVFWPQDLHIFVFGMLILMIFVVLFTVVFGRVWCGWACPQTIFMELVFRRIEYWIEGDRPQQLKPVTPADSVLRRWRKVLKHIIFFAVSFVIANIFLSYIIGADRLWTIITDPIDRHIGGLVSMLLFTLVFYSVFAYVREIVCTTICPYGRLQGVLLDDQSLTVAYDYRRGEPRGHRKRESTQPMGDCVDCGLCVQVCPTGIDIRNGLQLECVACTACIDACDAVMTKLNRPKRLIGFYTSAAVAGRSGKGRSVRAVAYTAVLAILIGVFGWLVLSRSAIEGTLLRAKGSTYQLREDGTVSNLYSLELINKSHQEIHFGLETDDSRFTIQPVNPIDVLQPGSSAQLTFFLVGRSAAIFTYKTKLGVRIVSDGKTVETLKTTFVAPPGGK